MGTPRAPAAGVSLVALPAPDKGLRHVLEAIQRAERTRAIRSAAFAILALLGLPTLLVSTFPRIFPAPARAVCLALHSVSAAFAVVACIQWALAERALRRSIEPG